MDRVVVPVLSPSATSAIAEVRAHGPVEVVGVIVDVGGMPQLDGLRDAVLAAGAARCHVIDARDAVAERACWPALRAGALGVRGVPIEAAVALPAVASALVEVVAHEGATAAVPWAGDPHDRRRLRALIRGLAPGLGLISVAQLGVEQRAQNLWARVESAGEAPPGPSCASVRDASAVLRLGFDDGTPRRVNGVTMSAVELIESLDTILHDRGVGAEIVQSGVRGDDETWRVDAPAARLLQASLASVTGRRFDPALADMASTVASAYAELIRDGAWFGTLRRALDGFVDRALDGITAEVTVRIAGGRIEVDA